MLAVSAAVTATRPAATSAESFLRPRSAIRRIVAAVAAVRANFRVSFAPFAMRASATALAFAGTSSAAISIRSASPTLSSSASAFS